MSLLVLICVAICQADSAHSTSNIAVFGLVQGGAQPVPYQGPYVTVDSTVCNFKTVRPLSKNTATFTLHNTGSGVLKITDIKKCCGVVVTVEPNELTPDQGGMVKVVFNAGSKPGLLKKQITLLTNDPKHPRVVLTVTGTVVRTLDWSPKRLHLSWQGDQIICPDITLEDVNGQPFAVQGAVATGHCLRFTLDASGKQPACVLRTQVDRERLMALERPVGTIKIQVDHPDYKEVAMAFELVPPIQVIPNRILAFGVVPSRSLVRKVRLQDNQADPNAHSHIAVASVTAKKGSQARILRQTPTGRGCEIDLEVRPVWTEDQAGHWSDELILDCGGGRSVTVPMGIFFKGQGGGASQSSNRSEAGRMAGVSS